MSNSSRNMLEYEKIVMDELLKNGYPKESIVLEGQLDSRRFVDFIVADNKTGLPLMMIEVKSCSERTEQAVKSMAYQSLKKYYEKSTSPIKAIAAILNREENNLEFIDFTEAIKEKNIDRSIENYALPPYEALIIGADQKIINQQKEKQKRNINMLKLLCWGILPLVCLVLIILDAIRIYPFSTFRLIVIGAGAIISLIPCFKEIKIGELSLKNQIVKHEEKEK